MRLFVIGATGRTGQEIVQQALDRGHKVTAVVRSLKSIALKNERLSVLKGNATDESQLSEVMQNHERKRRSVQIQQLKMGSPSNHRGRQQRTQASDDPDSKCEKEDEVHKRFF